MDFVGRKATLGYFFWMIVTFLVCLCGSNGEKNQYTILRSERDIFTNLKCDGNSCTQSQCDDYGAECVADHNCDYCRCLDNSNTFIINENDKTKGKCVSDELIVPESGHKNILMISEQKCASGAATKSDCYKFKDHSSMAYLEDSVAGNEIKKSINAPKHWRHASCFIREYFNFLQHNQQWFRCDTGINNFISVKRNGNLVELTIKKKIFKDWSGSLLEVFVRCRQFKHSWWPGSHEERCVLLKLESLPTYSTEVTKSSSTPTSTTTHEVKEITTPTGHVWPIFTVAPKVTPAPPMPNPKASKPPNESPNSEVSTTENPQEGLEDKFESSGTKSVATAVTVPLLLVVLVLVLGFLLCYRRRKRVQQHESRSGNNNRAVNYYEDPNRVYEAPKQDGHEGLDTKQGASMNRKGIVYRRLPTEEYAYAKTEGIPKTTEKAKAAPGGISGTSTSDPVYQTLEKDYPANNKIFNPALTEVEYTYAKDTDMPKNTKAMFDGNRANNEAVYSTLEEEEPVSNEQEYSYAENTYKTNNVPMGLPATPANNDGYHTLEEPTNTQAAGYSTLEEPRNVNNSQVTYDIPHSGDPVYNVLEKSNDTNLHDPAAHFS